MDAKIDFLKLIEKGLPHTSAPKKVVIVGAGMAGLTAAYELKRAGHQPVVLEAQQRLGGRVHTLREPFSEGLYAEVGAMRIPRAHKMTLAYIEKFGLKTNDFTMDNPQAYYYIGGRKVRAGGGRCEPGPARVRSGRARARPDGRPVVAQSNRTLDRLCSQSRATTPGRRSLNATMIIPRGSSWRPTIGPWAPSRCTACWPTRRR